MVCLFLCLGTNARAAEWWLVSQSGEKPNRVIYSVDLQSFYERTPMPTEVAPKPNTIIRADFVAVYESQPLAAVVYVNTYDCPNQQWRNNERFEHPYNTDNYKHDRSGTGFAPVSGKNAFDRAIRRSMEFVCDPKARTVDNLMAPFSTYPSHPTAEVWAGFWKDATQPKYTTSKTKEEVDAKYAATLAKTRDLLAQSTATATAAMGKIQQNERDDADKRNACLQGNFRGAERMNNLCTAWYGKSETELIAAWGIPQKVYDTAGARFLTYFQGYNSTTTNGYGAVLNSRDYTCSMDITLKNGKFTGLRAAGNDCSNMNYRGPN